MSNYTITSHQAPNPRLGMQPVPAPVLEGDLNGPTAGSTHLSGIAWTLIALGVIFFSAFLWFYLSILFTKASSTTMPIEYWDEHKSSASDDLEDPLSRNERNRLYSWLHRRERERFNAQSPDLAPRPLSPPLQTKLYFTWQPRNPKKSRAEELSAPAFQRMSLVPNLRPPPKAHATRRFAIFNNSECPSPAPAYRDPSPTPAYSSPVTADFPQLPKYPTPSPPAATLRAPSITPIPAVWDARREKGSAKSSEPQPRAPKSKKLVLTLGKSESLESLVHEARWFAQVRDSLVLDKGAAAPPCNYF
ncbi:hypothetical protein HWV62_12908 [Athelia sp. TMB]|nr:hypothetical protein HWV62_12908 [Athelia sp. TMB]